MVPGDTGGAESGITSVVPSQQWKEAFSVMELRGCCVQGAPGISIGVIGKFAHK